MSGPQAPIGAHASPAPVQPAAPTRAPGTPPPLPNQTILEVPLNGRPPIRGTATQLRTQRETWAAEMAEATRAGATARAQACRDVLASIDAVLVGH